MHQLTQLPIKDLRGKTIEKNSRAEMAARQIVLGSISQERAARKDWAFYGGGENAFDMLVNNYLAYKDFDGTYHAGDVLQERQAAIVAKRISFDQAAEKIGKVLPTKAKTEKRNPPVNLKSKGSTSTLTDFLKDNERENAVQYADLIGKPLMFGQSYRDSIPYYNCENLDLQGFPFFVGQCAVGYWDVISVDIGLGICANAVRGQTKSSKAGALAWANATLNYLPTVGKSLAEVIAANTKVTQQELRNTYLNHQLQGVAA